MKIDGKKILEKYLQKKILTHFWRAMSFAKLNFRSKRKFQGKMRKKI